MFSVFQFSYYFARYVFLFSGSPVVWDQIMQVYDLARKRPSASANTSCSMMDPCFSEAYEDNNLVSVIW